MVTTVIPPTLTDGTLTGVIQGAVASDGVFLPLASLAKTNTVSGGLIMTTTVSYVTNTYVQTNTYSSGVLLTQSAWVKQ